jgi:thiol:disulfide interchange protein
MWKKFINIVLLILPILFFILLFSQKDKLTNYLSEEIKKQSNTEINNSIDHLVDSLYNYQSNNQSYQLTFLEFGAKGCVACRKMEFVLKEVEEEYPEEIKVTFLNILQTQNQDLMKYFGVVAIPTQVLLDKSGNEFFRHTGYISFSDLEKQFTSSQK